MPMSDDENDDNRPSGMDDDALWEAYSRDIKPLKGKKRKRVIFSPSKPPKLGRMALLPDSSAPYSVAAPDKTPRADLSGLSDVQFGLSVNSDLLAARASLSAQQLDKNTAERLRRGQIPMDDRIDLHGLYQEQARHALYGFIESAYHRRLRCVLVVTGKGRLIFDGDDNPRRADQDRIPGVIKRNFKSWLAVEPYASMILKIQKSQIKDGGEGAYYILLRRQK